MNFSNSPHRRYNPLTGEWLQVSPHRTQRPLQGQQVTPTQQKKAEYDPGCYLCPRNKRAGSQQNPDYPDTFVFNNDYSALLSDTPEAVINEKDLLIARTERGICRVICYSPRHDLTLPEMSIKQIRRVVDVWSREYEEIGSKSFINYVQIFENKGEVMGCSNPHPHGQIWAQQSIPNEVQKEMTQQLAYYKSHRRTLLSDYIELELRLDIRIVAMNDDFVVLVPFWAVWPFETLVVSRRPFGRFTDMKDQEKTSLADIISQITIRYDNIFRVSFPYSAGFHPAPTDGKDHREWHFHMHFFPPLLRSATVKKFMVGYEMLGNAQRDITAESVAQLLRDLPGKRFN